MFAGPLGASSVKPLVEFKAGKCSVSGKTITPEKRKGTVQLIQGSDALMHFQWKDRTTGAIEDDLIVFPEEATYKKVTQSSGRVYLFEFRDSSRKLFIWMQDLNAEKDNEYTTKINQYINNPPSDMGELNQPMFQMPQQQQSNIPIQTPVISNDRPTQQPRVQPTPQQQIPQPQQPSTSLPPNSSRALQLSALQNILSGLPVPNESILEMQRQNTVPYVLGHNLQQIITPESIIPLFNLPDVVQRLLPYLPEERRTEQELRDIIRSPQIQQAIQTLSFAIESGQLPDIVRSLGLEGAESLLLGNQQSGKDKEEKTS